MAIQSPNYTQFPNEILDECMSKLSGAEFKVISAICRKTFGWKKDRDYISISQIKIMTGLGKQSIVRAIAGLEKHGLIICNRDAGKTNSYGLNIVPVQKVDRTSPKSGQDEAETSPKSGHTKETYLNKYKEIVRDLFTKNNPSYYHDGKQAKAIDNIYKRFPDVDSAVRLIDKFIRLTKTGNIFWREKPLTPSMFSSLIDHVISATELSIVKPKTAKEIYG